MTPMEIARSAMRKLKPSIKYFLIGIAVSQTLTYSLNAFNRHLEANTRALELNVEDYTVIKLSSLETNEIEPCSTNSAKTYMDYRMITSKTSDQYRYIQEHMTVRDGYLVDGLDDRSMKYMEIHYNIFSEKSKML